jgi:hypothetical protein
MQATEIRRAHTVRPPPKPDPRLQRKRNAIAWKEFKSRLKLLLLVVTSFCALHVSASSEYFVVQLGALSVILLCVVELVVLGGQAIGSVLDWIASGNACRIDRAEADVLETASQLLLQDTISLLYKGAVGAIIVSSSLAISSIAGSLPLYLNWTQDGQVGDWLCYSVPIGVQYVQRRLKTRRDKLSKWFHLHCTEDGQRPTFSFTAIWKFVLYDLVGAWREVEESLESLQHDLERLLGKPTQFPQPLDWTSTCSCG